MPPFRLPITRSEPMPMSAALAGSGTAGVRMGLNLFRESVTYMALPL